MRYKEEITEAVRKETGAQEIVIEVPPNPEMGDFALPCFQFVLS
jgi:arginyl-tRNA synthetase